MSKKKPAIKKTIEYVRPRPGTFGLEKFPGVEFTFRIISIDDEAWCVQNLGKKPWDVMTSDTASAVDLCRLYFYFLTDEGKIHFVPFKKEEMDFETGLTKEVIISGPRLFMQSIDGGSLTEMTLIGRAFLQTIFASRPISELPEDIKKNLMDWVKKNQKAEKEVEPGPMGSQVVELRPPKSH